MADITAMEDLFIRPRPQYQPTNASYFRSRNEELLLPMDHIIFDYTVEFLLDAIRDQLGMIYFDPKDFKRSRMLHLKPQARMLLAKMIEHIAISPVNVLRGLAINEPSPLNPNRPSVIGLDTMHIKQELRDVDYFYRPATENDELKVALSLFMEYDHVPIRITI
uniref:Uncharacterized protein n=1 Tax=viral metagenome TaxID=1070528 RepID=A0A6C0BKQ0_9ZZZZ